MSKRTSEEECSHLAINNRTYIIHHTGDVTVEVIENVTNDAINTIADDVTNDDSPQRATQESVTHCESGYHADVSSNGSSSSSARSSASDGSENRQKRGERYGHDQHHYSNWREYPNNRR
jgi:hypothetical protein